MSGAGPLQNPAGEAAVRLVPVAYRMQLRDAIRRAYETPAPGNAAADRRMPSERDDAPYPPSINPAPAPIPRAVPVEVFIKAMDDLTRAVVRMAEAAERR